MLFSLMDLIKKIFFNAFDRAQILYWRLRYDYFFKQYRLHPSFSFNGHNILFYGKGEIEIGEGSYIGELSSIQAEETCKVKIGKYCRISHNVRIYTSSIIADQDLSVLPHKSIKGDVSIGDYVWIGVNTYINPGVTIGNNAVIGANSVITKNVPAFAIVGGVPAKLIRMKNIN